VLADAQPITRQGTRLLLESKGHTVVGETPNGSRAVQLADTLQPDAMVIDLELDVLPGLETIRQVKRVSPNTAILVLTQVEACASVIGAMRAGAGGYVLRSCDTDEFAQALDAVIHGDTYVCPRAAGHLVPGRCSVGDDEDCCRLACLTARELQITRLVTQGYSSPQIAGMLGITAATADRHRANIMRKLNVHSVSAVVLFAVRSGLVDVHRASA
jgi:DNA-binding NarL/FixJ family response regulator